MAKKNIFARVVNKHDTEANWAKATGFTPMAGETIVYDPDNNYNYSRIKIGDGTTNVNDLPFLGDDKVDIPSSTSEIIVDNPDGSVDSGLQSFVYTLPADNTIITVDGWGYPDHIWMNYSNAEGMDSGDQYYFSSYSSPLSLPADLPDEAKNSWKAGITIKVYYNSDIITSAIATYSGGSYVTDQQVDAKIEEYVNEAILGGSW